MSTSISAPPILASPMVNFQQSDVEALMDHYDLSEEVKRIIREERLLPVSLISRLHNSFPKHSLLSGKPRLIFSKGKNKYSGLAGFRKICEILDQHGIVLSDIKERELFVEVYAFLATRHILNTIDWDNYQQDPVFQLVFPQPNMIDKAVVEEYSSIEDDDERERMVVEYRNRTNPHDGKQILNRPTFYSEEGKCEAVDGGQHKYPQVFLLFDKTTQGCFAYCTYCFRHAQVRGDEDMFIQDDVDQVHEYLRQHKEVTDILITGGDAGYMPYSRLYEYLNPIMEDPELMHIRNIRIASRALTYQPGVILDPKYDDILKFFNKLIDHGIQLIWMANFSTPKEFLNINTLAAIRRLRKHHINIRSQSPMMNHVSLFMDETGKVDIDRSAQNWIDLGHILMMLGINFHSIYCARPTGEHDYFTAPLADMDKIFSKIYRTLPSLGRPSRYITMTSSAGKTSLLGTAEVNGRKAFVLKFNEARNMEWLDRVFLAEFDEKENTIEKLKPFDGGEYFYMNELAGIEDELQDKFDKSMNT